MWTRALGYRTIRIALLCPLLALAQRGPDLADLTLEDLMSLEVTSVSKRSESLMRAPGAIYVITQDEIRRSGLSNLPDILRLAPGVNVAQLDANKWAISARGFQGQYGNKLLVLVDGRAVYIPVYSGVYWDEQIVMIEDIERIEVIRGPGAALWGANAVNGVINIITKSAADTKGGLVTARTGNVDRSVNAARYGGSIGDRGAYRVFATHAIRGDLDAAEERNKEWDKGWNSAQAGFRSDVELSTRDSLMLTGSGFHETSGITANIPALDPPYTTEASAPENASGAFLVGSWQHRRSSRSIFTVKSYVDHVIRDSHLLLENRTTSDLDFQHSWTPHRMHDIVWGGGVRYNVTRFRNSTTVSFEPRMHQHLYSAFLQDEIRLAPDKFSVILGTKFEHNVFTASEIQPSVRLLWTPTARTSAWAAVSRAVRTPSYFEDGGDYAHQTFPGPGNIPIEVRISGSKLLPVESLRAHEIGYRTQVGSRLTIDWTGFFNIYDDLRTYDLGQPTPAFRTGRFYMILPTVAGAKATGKSVGSEVTAAWQAAPWWKLTGSHSWLNLRVYSSSSDINPDGEEGLTPKHQATLRSEMELGRRFQLDTNVFRVTSLPTTGVPGYTRIDLRLGWRPNDRLELSAGSQNLQGGRHLEYISEAPFGPETVGRSFFVKASWTF